MIYIAVQLFQIFCAGGKTDRGGTRGPRGPKNAESAQFTRSSSIFDSILVSQNSIQVIIEFKINCGDSIQKIIQFNSQGIVDTGCIRINYAVFPTRYRSGPNYWNGPEKVQKLHLSWELLILWVNCATIEIFWGTFLLIQQFNSKFDWFNIKI